MIVNIKCFFLSLIALIRFLNELINHAASECYLFPLNKYMYFMLTDEN